MGTVGGSLAHADPAAEWAAIVLLLNGQIHVEGTQGNRSIMAGDFFLDWMSTALKADEIITAVSFDIPSRRAGSALEEVSRRNGDFAMAGVGAFVELDEGVIVDARIATIGLDLTPKLCREAANAFHGNPPTTEAIARATDAVMTLVQPLDDQHASADYKRKVSGFLTQKAFHRALERIGSTNE
jgi:carbon-monoxide dehydrogenase medium subunit